MIATLEHPALKESRETTIDPVLDRMTRAYREDLLRIEAGAGARALQAAIDEDARPVAIRYRGRVIMAQPVDTRRFVLAMAKHMCFN